MKGICISLCSNESLSISPPTGSTENDNIEVVRAAEDTHPSLGLQKYRHQKHWRDCDMDSQETDATIYA